MHDTHFHEHAGHPRWQDIEPPKALPARGALAADVCVVGLGASGLSAILALRAEGRTVIGLDAGPIGGGAAGRNGGFLLAGAASFHHEAVARFGHSNAVALYDRTRRALEALHTDMPDLVWRTGSLRIAADPDEERECRFQLAQMRADGLSVEPYTGREGHGLLFPDDAGFHPYRRTVRLAERAIDQGAALHPHSPAVAIESGRVHTPDAVVRAGAIVVAVDGMLERLLPSLAPRVRTARLQMLGTAPDPSLRIDRPVYFRHGMEYWQQLPDGSLVAGGYRDLDDDRGFTWDIRPTEPIQAALERLLRDRIGSRAPITHRWAAAAAFTHHGAPIVEEVLPGVFAAGAYNGTGNLVGTIAASAAAEMICRGSSADWELFRRLTSTPRPPAQ